MQSKSVTRLRHYSMEHVKALRTHCRLISRKCCDGLQNNPIFKHRFYQLPMWTRTPRKAADYAFNAVPNYTLQQVAWSYIEYLIHWRIDATSWQQLIAENIMRNYDGLFVMQDQVDSIKQTTAYLFACSYSSFIDCGWLSCMALI